MRFKTCNCEKDVQKCVRTGIWFEYQGDERVGDAFYCQDHGAMNIFGINPSSFSLQERKGLTKAYGYLVEEERFPWGGWLHLSNGRIDLSEKDQKYMEKWDRYIFKKGEK